MTILTYRLRPTDGTKPRPVAYNRPLGNFFRQLCQDRTLGRADGKVHGLGGLGHEAALAGRKPSGPGFAFVVPAQNERQYSPLSFRIRGDDGKRCQSLSNHR